MNAIAFDRTQAWSNSNRMTASLENLLVEYVRASFREEAREFRSLRERTERLKVSASEAEGRLQDKGMSKLAKLNACLGSLAVDGVDAQAEIKKLEDEQKSLQDLLERGKLDRWSEVEKSEAKSTVDAAMSEHSKNIDAFQEHIDALLNQSKQLALEAKTWRENKSASEGILSSLESGAEPKSYQIALKEELQKREEAFEGSLIKLNIELIRQRKAHAAASDGLQKLKEEFDEASARESRLNSARNIGWLVRRLDPRSMLGRGAEAIKSDLDFKYASVKILLADIANSTSKLETLRREHEQQMAMLPQVVRLRLLDAVRLDVSKASTRLDELSRMSDEISDGLLSKESDLDAMKNRYRDEHQQNLDACLREILLRAERSLHEVEICITAKTAWQKQVELRCSRLSKLIERRRVKLDAALLELQRNGRNHVEAAEREANRMYLRLMDRAARAGMVYEPATNSFRELNVHRNFSHGIRASYRKAGTDAVPMCTLPVLLQRRVQTGYFSKDDERLSSAIAFCLGKDAPSEADRAEFIDDFMAVFFGDEEDERAFFVSFVSIDKSDALVLVRPVRVLPQLRKKLPESMSLCVLCRLAYDGANCRDNTTLYVQDIAIVSDCEARPFEHSVTLARQTQKSGLPIVSLSLFELLGQVGSKPQVLRNLLDDRLKDWNGYLEWASEQVYRSAPWGVLGSGEWDGATWNGLIYFQDQRAAKALIRTVRAMDSPQVLCVYPLNEKWTGGGFMSDMREFRVRDFHVFKAEDLTDTPDDCPWPNFVARQVRMVFQEKDMPWLLKSYESAPLGLRDITEVIGQLPPIKRYRIALQQLQTVFFQKDPTTNKSFKVSRLSSAPYLMASLFQVSQAASPAGISGRLVNADLCNLYRLNADQRAAVEVMLATPEVAYIQGPPGTGKTTMIAAACAHFVRSGLRVLIASQTNLAVENALERLSGDPEVRQLWLRKNEVEQKTSTAIAVWYRMAADHVEKQVCKPFRALSEEVKHIEGWLERARRCEQDRSKFTQELKSCAVHLSRSEATLADKRLRVQVAIEVSTSEKWWTMAHGALASLSEWNPTFFSPALASDAAEMLKLFAKHDGKSPRLDVSPGALHRQIQERIQQLQILLSADEGVGGFEEAERVRKKVLLDWPSKSVPQSAPRLGDDQISQEATQAEAVVLRAQQSLEDARTRHDEFEAKAQILLVEIGKIVKLPEVPSHLNSAIDLIDRLCEQKMAQLKDVEPIREWLPLLDRWSLDLKPQILNPSISDTMGERYVRSANVIGITCNSDFGILSDSGFPRFDVVIIDEVSKATPLELLRPMLLAPKSILVGDHRQLPPSFDFANSGSNDKFPTADEDPDVLEREAELLRVYERLATASLFRNGFAEIHPGARAALFTQYRMHPQIMSLVNRFYEGRLQSGLVDPDGLSDSDEWSWRTHGLSLRSRTGGHYLSPDQHALWIDSAQNEAGWPAHEIIDVTGIGNELEARLVAQIVEDIVNACEREQRNKSIAVATFYNRQKNLIRSHLKSRLGGRFTDLKIDVETVDRFQGKEADIVIVSMVRSPPKGRLSKRSNPAKFERINVAFSRARDLLVVIGARNTFENFDVAIEPLEGGVPKRTRVYGQIIADIRDAGGLWQAKDILGKNTHEPIGQSK